MTNRHVTTNKPRFILFDMIGFSLLNLSCWQCDSPIGLSAPLNLAAIARDTSLVLGSSAEGRRTDVGHCVRRRQVVGKAVRRNSRAWIGRQGGEVLPPNSAAVARPRPSVARSLDSLGTLLRSNKSDFATDRPARESCRWRRSGFRRRLGVS